MIDSYQSVINLPIAKHEVPHLRQQVGWDRRDEEYPLLFERCVCWCGVRDESGQLLAFAYLAGTGLQHGYIEDVIVHPSYQQKGIGKRIVQSLLMEADRRGIEIVTCTFSKEHTEFYTTCGLTLCAGGLWRKSTK